MEGDTRSAASLTEMEDREQLTGGSVCQLAYGKPQKFSMHCCPTNKTKNNKKKKALSYIKIEAVCLVQSYFQE